MKNKNLFSKRQYGFISGRSTQLQLLEVLKKWTEAFDKWKMKEFTYMMIWFGVCKYILFKIIPVGSSKQKPFI